MKRLSILGGSLILILIAAFVFYRHLGTTTQQAEPLIKPAAHGDPKDVAASTSAPPSKAAPEHTKNPARLTSANEGQQLAAGDSPNLPQAETAKPAKESTHSASDASGKRSSGSLEHQRISKGLADQYIGGMYTEEKAKEPMPEMAAVMHNQLSNEELDKEWGPATQQTLDTYWRAALAPYGTDIDLTTVACKSMTCEVIGVVQDIDSKDLNGLMDRWNAIERQMQSQPWWAQSNLGQPQDEVAMGPNNSTLLFLCLFRQTPGK